MGTGKCVVDNKPKNRQSFNHGLIAQWLEQALYKRQVMGSTPIRTTNFKKPPIIKMLVVFC
jgi:hypothetical protein